MASVIPWLLAHGQSEENQAARSLGPLAGLDHQSTPAKFIDFAYAPAQAAERRVAMEHKIRDTLRSRLVAIVRIYR
jgi:hypothetical protein